MNDPEIVSRDEWLVARRRLLAAEKELTHHRDRVNAERRRLPMVEIERRYEFQGAEGPVTLLDLFGGRSQLLVYHFMFEPEWDEGCESCSLIADNIGNLEHLHARDTTLVLVSRAPIEKLHAYRSRMGWTVPWFSSFGSLFNYDFHVTIDADVAPVEYNYRGIDELQADNEAWTGWSGEQPGTSAFLRHGDRIFHTYSSYGRGGDLMIGTYNWLDLTARGRQEDWEEPAGRSDGPMMHWVRRHDQYAT